MTEANQPPITNAQLAAYCGVMPSTIQFWRKGTYKPTKITLGAVAVATGVALNSLSHHLKQGTLIKLLETNYIKAGRPSDNVTGRDFTDAGKLHPIKQDINT